MVALRCLATGAAAAIAAALISSALAQSDVGEGSLPAFEYASVLPSHPAVDPIVSVSPETGAFTARGVSVLQLVSYAYDVSSSSVVGGPDWVHSARYQVHARPTEEFVSQGSHLIVGEVRQLVKGLLFDYFGLEAHENRAPMALERAGADPRTVLVDVVIIDHVSDQPAHEPQGGLFELVPEQ